MGKKKHKQPAPIAAGWGETGYGAADGAEAASSPGGKAGFDKHFLQGLVGSRQTEQFLLGALLGAAAVYVLGNEEIRGKLMTAAMKMYAGVAGGLEEVKEQMADIQAEVAAGQHHSS